MILAGTFRRRALPVVGALALLAAASSEAAAQHTPGLNADFYNYNEGTDGIPPRRPPGSPLGNLATSATLVLERVDPQINLASTDVAVGTGVNIDDFMSVWTGYILSGAAGTYSFGKDTDDGAAIFIRAIGAANWTTVVDDWTGQGMGSIERGNITLAANTFYEFRFEHYDSGGGHGYIAYWTPPNATEVVIPASAFYSALDLPDAPDLTATAIVSGAQITWLPVASATGGYEIFMGPSSTGPWTSVYTGTTPSHTQNGLTPLTTYHFYGVSLGSGGLVSEPSETVSVVPTSPPPRTNSHSEGLFDDKCACGSSVPGPGLPALAGLAGLALAAAARRRK